MYLIFQCLHCLWCASSEYTLNTPKNNGMATSIQTESQFTQVPLGFLSAHCKWNPSLSRQIPGQSWSVPSLL